MMMMTSDDDDDDDDDGDDDDDIIDNAVDGLYLSLSNYPVETMTHTKLVEHHHHHRRHRHHHPSQMDRNFFTKD